MKKKVIVSFLVVTLLFLCSRCGFFKDPEIINNTKVKQKICDLIWIYDYSPSDLKVIDWVINEDQIGDDFTGYIVTYEANNGESYILANILEFDKTSRWEVEVVANEKYLTEIRKYIE